MYSFPVADEPIRQGDIFRSLPKLELTLGKANLPDVFQAEEQGARIVEWFQVAESNGIASANALVIPVYGIVITQDCDALRCPNVAFAQIRTFKDIYPPFKEDAKPGKIADIVTEHSRKNQKWFYLAANDRLGFVTKMGVDFQSVFEVRREMLENYKDRMRVGRLDDEVAWPHFRERVAEFFRRYPYNEWYPLNSDEVKAYEDKKKQQDNDFRVALYPWQLE